MAFSRWLQLKSHTIGSRVNATPGVYLLRNGRAVRHVDRAHRDLRMALATRVGGPHRYFSFEPSSSLRAAFRRQSQLYHSYRPQDNPAHPTPAGEEPALPCARCSHR